MSRVLVVDDEPSMRHLVCEGLREHGIDHAEAANGDEALRLLCRSVIDDPPFDAVVLDIVMPVVDGWQVLDAIKSNPLWSHLTVVVLTGRATSQEDVARVSAYNGVFIEKHGSFAHLLEVLLARLVGN
jgi:CheY-like chemotaxis protein